MRNLIFYLLTIFYIVPLSSQEGSKIDLENVNVASERLPSIRLFGVQYTIRGRDKFLEEILTSHFFKPDLKIIINLEEFISKKRYSFLHNGAIRINIDSKKLKNYNRFNNPMQRILNVRRLLNKIKSVQIDSSLSGILQSNVLKKEISLIQKQIDSLDIQTINDTIYVDLKNSRVFKKLFKKRTKKITELDYTPLIEISIFTD